MIASASVFCRILANPQLVPSADIVIKLGGLGVGVWVGNVIVTGFDQYVHDFVCIVIFSFSLFV